ncbi:hypothetical protein HDZ31DRAFT_65746 [Schizophyllum fasciatum]
MDNGFPPLILDAGLVRNDPELVWYSDEDGGGHRFPFGAHAQCRVNEVPEAYFMWAKTHWSTRYGVDDAVTQTLDAIDDYIENLVEHIAERFADFVVPCGVHHRGKTIRRCSDQKWLSWVTGRAPVQRLYPLFVKAVNRWMRSKARGKASVDPTTFLHPSHYQADLRESLQDEDDSDDGCMPGSDDASLESWEEPRESPHNLGSDDSVTEPEDEEASRAFASPSRSPSSSAHFVVDDDEVVRVSSEDEAYCELERAEELLNSFQKRHRSSQQKQGRRDRKTRGRRREKTPLHSNVSTEATPPPTHRTRAQTIKAAEERESPQPLTRAQAFSKQIPAPKKVFRTYGRRGKSLSASLARLVDPPTPSADSAASKHSSAGDNTPPFAYDRPTQDRLVFSHVEISTPPPLASLSSARLFFSHVEIPEPRWRRARPSAAIEDNSSVSSRQAKGTDIPNGATSRKRPRPNYDSDDDALIVPVRVPRAAARRASPPPIDESSKSRSRLASSRDASTPSTSSQSPQRASPRSQSVEDQDSQARAAIA